MPTKNQIIIILTLKCWFKKNMYLLSAACCTYIYPRGSNKTWTRNSYNNDKIFKYKFWRVRNCMYFQYFQFEGHHSLEGTKKREYKFLYKQNFQWKNSEYQYHCHCQYMDQVDWFCVLVIVHLFIINQQI